jgi:hypothetical protein
LRRLELILTGADPFQKLGLPEKPEGKGGR